MAVFLGRLTLLGILVMSLTGCQMMKTTSLKNIRETGVSTLNAQIFCSGTENCEFERLDQIQIVDSHHKLSRSALKAGVVRLQAENLSQPNALYMSVPAGQHEVVIRFYPVSADKAETLHVIHHFSARERYTFNMYRARSRHQGSLLNVSAPEPLCVDLKQRHKTIRRFCRPYNVLTGLGEFVEKKI